jgi:hypothetical protein
MSTSGYSLRGGREVAWIFGIACLLSLLAHAGAHDVEPSAEPRAVPVRPTIAPATGSVMQRRSKVGPAASTRRSDASKSTLARAAEETAATQQARPRTKSKSKVATRPPQMQPAPAVDPRRAALLARQTEDQIRELLLRARRAAAAGRLIEPSIELGSETVVAVYKQVLALAPSQPEALAGLERVRAVLARETEFAAFAGDKARAQAYVALLRSLQPNAGALLELEARVQALDASPVVLSARQRDRYGRSAQSIERARSYLDNQRLDLRTITQALNEYDRAVALVPSAPGLPLLKERITVLFPEATRRELAEENSQRALKVVQTARERGWSTPELEPLEAEVKATMRPGRYDTTFAECPDSVAQACKQRSR